MHKSTLFYLIAAVVFFKTTADAQEIVKPTFKYLSHITYSVTLNEKVEIRDIVEINEKGQLHLRSKYYNGVADTTYQLSNNTIKKLNEIFNGNTPLNSYMTTKKLQNGHHFAGPLEYLDYIDQQNKSHQIIIVEPFMESRFNEALDNLAILPSKGNTNLKEVKDPTLEDQILKTHKAASYIPKIEEPPPMM
ncbi:hypothetical protein [Mucilaginibacter jinjuensis]|uniref:GLPGLI family protein n=1 Tax=Mucilaginibacter jinjuensis TaxID=1176721 RepID=A0ABY7T301_9SPHI|nr:hypothetical protein [Mucilaginibacter jinjuensis]WCT10178.1 hypothetical protein PQO05_15695 [Mucilaginibacter jinjuensis]